LIGSPLFEKVEISLTNGQNVTINNHNNNKESVYIDKLSVDGKPYNKNWFDHDKIIKGMEIDFHMSNNPNYNWGSTEESIPYSMSEKN
jgi:putative alpha-1,2-mannosidase